MITRSPGRVDYTGFDQPDVDVYVLEREAWCPGELRAWRRDAGGKWWADVQWRPGAGQGNYLDTFPSEHVRPATTPAPTTDR